MKTHEQNIASSPPARKKRAGRSFSHRLAVNLCLLVIGIVVLGMAVAVMQQSLWRSDFATGYLMIACVFFLASYNLRKKLPFLPVLGSSRLWMQLHIYVGFGTIAVFVTHVGWRIPDGTFERLLATLYLVVTASGIYGLYITRAIPRKLTTLGNEFIYEQIPELKRQLAGRIRVLMVDSCESTDVLGRYYVRRLATFFERPRSWAYVMAPSARESRRLISEIKELDRFLSPTQRPVRRDVQEMVRQKEDLDYHWVLQGRLKFWLFLHIGLTYGLLFVSVLHGLIVHAFAGGLL